jgi:hypothetical protein
VERKTKRIVKRSKVLYTKKLGGRTALNDSVQSLPRVPCQSNTDALLIHKFNASYGNFKMPMLADNNAHSAYEQLQRTADAKFESLFFYQYKTNLDYV